MARVLFDVKENVSHKFERTSFLWLRSHVHLQRLAAWWIHSRIAEMKSSLCRERKCAFANSTQETVAKRFDTGQINSNVSIWFHSLCNLYQLRWSCVSACLLFASSPTARSAIWDCSVCMSLWPGYFNLLFVISSSQHSDLLLYSQQPLVSLRNRFRQVSNWHVIWKTIKSHPDFLQFKSCVYFLYTRRTHLIAQSYGSALENCYCTLKKVFLSLNHN